MATFVLVHGGGHGGWCWQRVAPLLRAEGHDVYTPTLTGLGERAHLMHPGIDLDTHIADVVGVLQFEDLTDVILVGHSYGGMVITGVADRATARIGQLVYLDAAVPRNGQSLVDVAGPLMAAARREARVQDGVELVLWPGLDIIKFYGVTEPADVEWVHGKLTPHPWKCFEQTLRLTNEAAVHAIPRTDINCGSPLLPARANRSVGADRVWEVESGHDLMITIPKTVAEMLLRVPSEVV